MSVSAQCSLNAAACACLLRGLLYYLRLARNLALTLRFSPSSRQTAAELSLSALLSLSKPPLTHETDLSYHKNN
jgi:hypothetical protein